MVNHVRTGQNEKLKKGTLGSCWSRFQLICTLLRGETECAFHNSPYSQQAADTPMAVPDSIQVTEAW